LLQIFSASPKVTFSFSFFLQPPPPPLPPLVNPIDKVNPSTLLLRRSVRWLLRLPNAARNESIPVVVIEMHTLMSFISKNTFHWLLVDGKLKESFAKK
jgi:hypothetical protein